MTRAGLQLSHYRLLDKLGEGTMGAVYRAEDVRLGRRVALKLLSAEAVADPHARERMLAEARAVSALEHPHICLLYEFDEAEGQPFLAMQLVEGETLRLAIARGPLTEARTREVIAAVAQALSAAHARGIVHRDVKPENVLLGADGSIKLSDFGIARLGHGAGLTATGAVMGTPSYLSPEQVGGAEANEASDQFSLAVVAYECLTGTLPFAGDSLAALLYAVANRDPTPPSRHRPGLDPAWDGVLSRALAKEPRRRYPSVRAFAEAVARVGAGDRATAAPAASGPSLAVLYFENLSADPDSDYFCAGITEDILTDLSKIAGLRVASRNAVARLRGQPVDISRAAAELGVATVLEGSVRRAGNRVRISAQLINAGDGFHLWAERYDRDLDDVFAVQEDIARSIAQALRGALTPKEAAALQQGRPAAAAAYDLYLRGRELYYRYTPEDNRRALECFERAVEVEPSYALAWAGTADSCGQFWDKGWDRDPAWIERGLRAAERAVELRPDLPGAYKALALVEEVRGEPDRAVAALRRALAVDPNFYPALTNLSGPLEEAGDLAGAERTVRRALVADPEGAFAHFLLTVYLFHARRYAECIQRTYSVQKTGRGPFYQLMAQIWRVLAYAHQGDTGTAAHELGAAKQTGLPPETCEAAESFLACVAGDHERARRGLQRLLGGAGDEPLLRWLMVEIAARLGEAGTTARLLREAEASRFDWARAFAVARIRRGFSAIRDAPEFRAWIGERGRRLVWPLEAPPLPPEDRAQFTDYSEASGLPQGDEIP
jgi:non-specific serine/threonine protein kinase